MPILRRPFLSLLPCLFAALWLGASSYPAAAQAPADANIRTPPSLPTPRINGARIVGARPGHPFFFHVPATGDRPMFFEAQGLPLGLKLDPATGNIAGAASAPGTYDAMLGARNARGAARAPLRIVIGDAIALTPPMGWNSWNHFGREVTEEEVKAAADAMVADGLIDHGWTYINVDDGWQGNRGGDGAITGNKRFPDIAALGSYVHGLGLKFGIYTSPGPQTCAGFEGSRGHEAQDAATYAGWGVDYVKYDLCSGREDIDSRILQAASALLPPEQAAAYRGLYHQRADLERTRGVSLGHLAPPKEAQLQQIVAQMNAMIDPARLQQTTLEANMAPWFLFGQALRGQPRDMIYSISSHGRADIWKWGPQVGANAWRTIYDISPSWQSVSYTGFAQGGLAPYATPGHWNDPDMLEIGNGGLSPDESYTHMTLWCMLAAPLLIGCDMTNMSDFTKSLFCNDEVIAVDQDPLGRQGSRVKSDGTTEVWTKPLSGGALAVAFFNRGPAASRMEISWAELGGGRPGRVRDLWRQQDVAAGSGGITASVASHGAEMFRIERN